MACEHLGPSVSRRQPVGESFSLWGTRDDPTLLLALGGAGRHCPGGVLGGLEIGPQSVVGAEERLHHQMWKIVDPVDRPSPDGPFTAS